MIYRRFTLPVSVRKWGTLPKQGWKGTERKTIWQVPKDNH